MKTLLTTVILIVTSVCSAQNFPANWTGKYTGELISGNIGRPNDTIPVDFVLEEVIKDSVWTYTMTYHSERYGELTKDYRIVSKTQGDTVNFFLDELNGIKMELSLMNNCFYGMYDVVGQRFVSTMRLSGTKGLVIELFAAKDQDPLITSAREEEMDFEAKSFKCTLHQTIYLTKKDE